MNDLNPDHLNTVIKILNLYLPNQRVVVFGSRINNTAKLFSDLDLCIMNDQSPLSLKLLGELREAFSESNLPFKVDILDWATTSDEFKEIIINNSCNIVEKSL